MQERNREDAFKYYITDSIFYYNNRQYLNYKLSEKLNPSEPIDKKTAEEIVKKTIKNAGITVVA